MTSPFALHLNAGPAPLSLPKRKSKLRRMPTSSISDVPTVILIHENGQSAPTDRERGSLQRRKRRRNQKANTK